MHCVRALKKLTGAAEAERLMLHKRRKSLACARTVINLHLPKNHDGDCTWSPIRGDVQVRFWRRRRRDRCGNAVWRGGAYLTR